MGHHALTVDDIKETLVKGRDALIPRPDVDRAVGMGTCVGLKLPSRTVVTITDITSNNGRVKRGMVTTPREPPIRELLVARHMKWLSRTKSDRREEQGARREMHD